MGLQRITRGTGLFGAITVGAGTKLRKLKRYAPSLTPAAVTTNTTAEQTFTVNGVAVGDVVLSVVKPTAQAGLGIVGSRVSALDTLAITFANVTAATLTPTAAQTYQVVVGTFA